MKKKISVLVTIILLIGAFTGCGSNSSNSSNVSTSTPSPADSIEDAVSVAQVTHVLAATGGSPKPFIYTDDNDNVIGYDAEVLYAVDELLEDYEFEFVITDFSAIFTGIDAGLYGIGVNNLTKKPEREEKYLFGEEYVGYNYTGVVVRIDDDSIQTLEDLAGKTTFTASNGGFAQLFEEAFNEVHKDDPIELIYTSAEELKILQDLAAGVVDFTFEESVMFDSYVEEFPELADTLKFIKFSDEETSQIQDPYSWFIFPKTAEGEALKAAVDGALKQLKEDGTLNEIAQKYLRYDVVR